MGAVIVLDIPCVAFPHNRIHSSGSVAFFNHTKTKSKSYILQVMQKEHSEKARSSEHSDWCHFHSGNKQCLGNYLWTITTSIYIKIPNAFLNCFLINTTSIPNHPFPPCFSPWRLSQSLLFHIALSSSAEICTQNSFFDTGNLQKNPFPPAKC